MADKGKKKPQGFAANPEGINRSGRPRGSRNKAKLIQAQLLFDDFSVEAAQMLIKIANGDDEGLGMKKGSISASLRQQTLLKVMDKALANEKEKLGAETGSKKGAVTEVEGPPQVFSKAK